MGKRYPAILFNAASGGGKGLVQELIHTHFPHTFTTIPNVTTRAPRPGDGSERIYLSEQDFLEQVERKEILMPIRPFGDNGPWYGVRTIDLYQDRPVIAELDAPYYEEFHKVYGDDLYVFGLLWSLEDLKKNMIFRNNQSPEDILKRLEFAPRIHNEILEMHSKKQLYKLIEFSHPKDSFDIESTIEKLKKEVIADIARILLHYS